MMPYSPISSKSTSLGSSMMSTVLLNARLWCGVARPCKTASTRRQCRPGGKQLARSVADTSSPDLEECADSESEERAEQACWLHTHCRRRAVRPGTRVAAASGPA